MIETKDTNKEEKSKEKCWTFELKKTKKKVIKSYCYSDTGRDIAQRFKPSKVTNIKREKDYEGFLKKYENQDDITYNKDKRKKTN